MRPIFLLALGYILLSRIGELLLSSRNERALLRRGGRQVPDDGLGGIVLVHTLWIGGLIVEELLGGPAHLDPLARGVAVGAFVLAEVARFSCIASLGQRWTVRVIVLDGEPPSTRGLYRWLHHPNYAAVVVSIAALPLALGRPWTALIGVPLKLLALRRRIAVEDAALRPAG